MAKVKVGFPQYIPPKYTGGGDLHLIATKTPVHGEGRTANIPVAISIYQPVAGGRNELFLEIHPETAKKRGVRNGDRVKISNDLGAIYARAHLYPASRPDTVVLPYGFGHFAHGRWASSRKSGNVNEILPNVSEPISNAALVHAMTVKVEKA